MKRQTLLKGALCLLMALVCNVAWADIDADGAMVTFTNVQQGGKEYALYINENGQLATSSSSAAALGDAAKFRATRLESGKWTFYNEAKNLYMIWRGNDSGYNNNAGVLGEYNATYCDWTLNSGDGSKMGTHYMVSKRSNGTDDGSVVILNNGSFDKYGNSAGWDSNYSNLYRIDIVELAPSTMEFFYNIGDGAYASGGWCKNWTSNNASKPSLAIVVDVNNVNGGQAEAIGVRPGKAGSATFNVNAGCGMLSLSFEAKGTTSHKIEINRVEQTVGTEWKKFVINGVNASTAQFILKGDNNNDCLLRNIRIVTSVLYVKPEVEGSWENNPNTHFGRVRATMDGNVSVVNLTTAHLEEATYMFYSGGNDVVDFNRAYRGFEFQGYSLGDEELGKSFTLTDALKSSITAENPLVAKFAATEAVTLFYDDDEFSYRIPAIATTGTGRIIAVSDYRHNLDDVGRDNHRTGTLRIDLVARTSDDNGKTWSNVVTIAEGDNSKAGSYLRAFGDAAIAAVGENIIVMAAAGDVMYGNASASNPNRMARIFSSDNGATWSVEEMTTKMYLSETSLIPSGVGAFFGSGKLAVDADFNGTGKARIYGALLIKNASRTDNNYVVYSDDLGATWKILGGSQSPIAYADEPKAEILPNGQILLSSRRQGGRVFNVFTYGTGETDKVNGVGTWGGAVNGCNNGGSNGTNGEIFCLNAKNVSGNPVKLLLQSQPKGGSGHYDRNDVTIWYKEITDADDTPSEIAGNWTEGLQISYQKSAYSAMSLQKDGRIALFFEEAPCYGDDHTKGYSMVYTPLSIENITKGNYFSPNAELDAVVTINVVLTDAQGNEYRDQVQSTFVGIAEELVGKYPYITLGDNANLSMENGEYIYTNTVELPFKVSNEEEIWHNIYWPSNGNDASQRYPVYLSATATDDEFVPKVTESNAYGNSSYNTADKADNISWAVYSVNGGFTFKFKNKLTGKFIQATSVATDNNKNVKYVDEASATAFVLDNVKQGDKCYGDYALKAEINGTVGYLCSTSATGYQFATHYNGKGHAGAWARFAEAPDFASLIAEVNATLDMIGIGLGQYTASEANVAAAAAAKEAMKNSATVKLNTLNSYKTLTNGATLNMPKAGQFFRIRGISGNYIDASSIHGNVTATTGQMSMKSAESCNYNGTIFYLDDEEKHLLNYATGRYIKETREIGAVGDAKGEWTFAESPRKGGKYALSCTTTNNNGANLHDNEGNRADRCSDNCGNRHDFTLEEVTALPVTVTTAGYATFYAPVAVKVEGVTANIVTVNGEWAILKEIEGGVIPANTGVILMGNADTYKFAITTTDNTIESALSGSVEAKYVNEDAYVLANGSEGVGLYKATLNQQNNSAFLNNAFKAYLPAPAVSAGVRFLSFNFGDDVETSIESVEGENGKAEIYDLAGRRVQNAQKGVFIVNGKVVIK